VTSCLPVAPFCRATTRARWSSYFQPLWEAANHPTIPAAVTAVVQVPVLGAAASTAELEDPRHTMTVSPPAVLEGLSATLVSP
jgi:hypothetical protein